MPSAMISQAGSERAMSDQLAKNSYKHHSLIPKMSSSPENIVTQATQKSQVDIQAQIDQALRGDTKLSFRKTLAESWRKTSGVKLYLLGAWLLLGAVVVVIMEIFNLFGLGTGAIIPETISAKTLLIRFAIDMMSAALIMPLLGGFIMMAIKHIDGKEISFKTLFAYTDKTLPLFIANLMIMTAVTLGLFLLILPGIYLCVAYACAPALIIDKNMKPWAALEASRKAVGKQWFRVAGLIITMVLIFIISALPLGIGLIWTLPMMIILFSVIYKNIFGISS